MSPLTSASNTRFDLDKIEKRCAGEAGCVGTLGDW